MNYNIYIIIGIIIFPLGILYAFYKDYKQNKKEFKLSLRTLGKGIAEGISFSLIIISLNYIYKIFIPFNKENGIEFNSKREKLGIPKIGENWNEGEYQTEQFTTYWLKPEPRNGHFKKIIEYGILNIKTETDYYQNEKIKGTFAWSKYDFEKKTTEYFLEKPNMNKISITEKGKVKYEKPIVIEKIQKSEFEKYKSE